MKKRFITEAIFLSKCITVVKINVNQATILSFVKWRNNYYGLRHNWKTDL